MKRIKLTRGKYAIIDDADFELVNQSKYSWCYSENGPDDKGGYAYGGEYIGNGKQRTVRMHRIILGARQGEEVDHRNGNRLDNRRSNLRLCSHKQNAKNRKMQKNNSGAKGVYFIKKYGTYRVRIQNENVPIHVGYFDSLRAAEIAYHNVARKLFGDFARM